MASIKRVRQLAESALNGFETLDLDTAVWLAKCELQTMIRALDRTDDSSFESVVASVNRCIGGNSRIKDSYIHYFADRKIMNFGFIKWLHRIFRL